MNFFTKILLSVLVGFISWSLLPKIEYAIPPVDEFIKSHGYPLEVHDVLTEDGYILTVFRIPHGKAEAKSRGLPIYLQHGLFGSAYNFLGLGPGSSIAFLLADKGYDVWVGNSRGNKYAMNHTTYKTSDPEFWNFSWHEMGIYDLPAVIDHILNHTKQEKITYVGYSLGGTILGILLSSNPEYSEKIDMFLGLVPGLAFPEVKPPLMKFMSLFHPPSFIDLLGNKVFYSGVDELSELLRAYCHPEGWFRSTCVGIYNMLGVSTQLRMEDMPAIYSSLLSFGSLKTLVHLGQVGEYGKLQQFNYGSSENIKIYGTDELQEFDIRKITIPSVLFYSDADRVVLPESVEKLNKILPHASTYRVPLETFNHLDFLYGKDAYDLLYKEIFRVLDERTESIEQTIGNDSKNKIQKQGSK